MLEYKGQKKVFIDETFNLNLFRSIGVLACWSNGERTDICFFNTPTLHYSSIFYNPILKGCKPWQNLQKKWKPK